MDDVIESGNQTDNLFQPEVSINEIKTRGKSFYGRSNNKDGLPLSRGLITSLQEALDFAGPKGYIATIPELIERYKNVEGKFSFEFADPDTGHTEENIGIDKWGVFYKKNKKVLVIVNGGGLLTPNKILSCYNLGFTREGAIKYTPKEFNDLLMGQLPDGSSIDLYPFEEIKKGGLDLPHRFGIVVPFDLVENLDSNCYPKKEFLENPLVIARNAGPENLESYFETHNYGGTLGCFHSFERSMIFLPQGNFVSFCRSLSNTGIPNYSGSFIAVNK